MSYSVRSYSKENGYELTRLQGETLKMLSDIYLPPQAAHRVFWLLLWRDLVEGA